MRLHVKIGLNDPCPCMSGKKFKKCCRGKIDWEMEFRVKRVDPVTLMSLRGRNLMFLDEVAGALQLDSIPRSGTHVDFKRAFTPSAVKAIHELIPRYWPSEVDLTSLLEREKSTTSGLYVGTYDPDVISRGVTRHSLYADAILLIDPLLDPRSVKPEFNPIERPEIYQSDALRWVTLWFAMAPWIQAGLIKFVRTPGDFDTALLFQTMETSRRRVELHPELKEALEINTREEAELHLESYKRQVLLSAPDAYIRSTLRQQHPQMSDEEIEQVIEYTQKLRDADPYYVQPEPGEHGSQAMLHITTGTNYEMAKHTALLSGSYVFTDLSYRWREIEVDRADSGIDRAEWSPFAKAFHELPFSYLNNVPLDAALTLRREERLSSLRGFLRRVWTASAPDKPFSEAAAVNLAAELEEKINEAEVEWKKIDADLLKWFGAEMLAGLSAMGPAIMHGGADWAAGGIAMAGIANLIGAARERSSFPIKYPATHFLRLKRRAPD